MSTLSAVVGEMSGEPKRADMGRASGLVDGGLSGSESIYSLYMRRVKEVKRTIWNQTRRSTHEAGNESACIDADAVVHSVSY